ncbi:MAG: glycosyltransferase [Paludibacteraceae bacterium]|nr:glycosyltransferase [Paludibacteraceae bacterium]
MRPTVIIAVYKNVAALEIVLKSLERQTYKNFEVIVAEDGNCEEMANFISSYSSDFPIQHLTQEDDGWNKNAILNKAIVAAKTDWLIFVDGDCVLHSRFVEMHVRYAKKGRVLAGKRVKLDKDLSEYLMQDISRITSIPNKLRKFLLPWKKGVGFVEEGFFIDPDGFFGFIPKIRKMKVLKGCNMSFSKEDVLLINGFDEDYRLPAIGEDIDISWRFEAAGCKLFSLRNLAVEYHLHHKENWSDQSINEAMMKEKMKENTYFCVKGIRK